MALNTQPRRRFGWLIPVIILLVVAWAVWHFLIAGKKAPQAAQGGPTPVSVAEVVSKNITLWKEFSGRLEAVDTAQVRSRVNGTIEKIYFKDGALVKKGDPLFLIDPRPYQAAVAQAEGQLTGAQAEVATARLESERATKLLKANAIARNAYDERIARAKSAVGAVRTAQGALDAARLNLHYTLVSAPISGKVSRAEVTVGNLVDSTPVLTTIVTQSPLYVSFEADEETYLSFIRGNEGNVNIPVEMGLSDETGTSHQGKIASFDNQLDPASGTIRARALFDNSDGRLVPGLYAKLRVGTPNLQPSVLVNEKAVNTDQTSKYVYVVGADNKATYRPVTLGAAEGELRIVKTGLKPGEKIIVNGLSRIMRPDTPVQPVPADMMTLQPLNPAPQGQAGAPAAAEQK